MDHQPYIEFRSVSFAYGKNIVLNEVSFIINEGCCTCIIGRSGSGKTTLLKLISGQIFPQKGEILIRGKSIARFSKQEMYQHRRNMGYLFQQGALFTDLSVSENIAFPIKEHTSLNDAEVQKVVKEKLSLVGLNNIDYYYPTELSGGMLKRVALARAIALTPNLMLYDEPFSGLDPISIQRILNLMNKIDQDVNTTSIMVTHYIKEALFWSKQILFLANQSIIFNGTPKQILDSQNEMVQEFLIAAFILSENFKYR